MIVYTVPLEAIKGHQFEFTSNGEYLDFSEYKCKRCGMCCVVGPDVLDYWQYFNYIENIQEKLTCDEMIIKDIIE